MNNHNIGILCQLRDIYRAIIDFENQFLDIHGLSLNEGMLLCTLSGSGTLSSGEIADMLGLTNSNASKVIRSVEKKGFIERTLGNEDRRQMYFTLTKDGKKVISEIKSEDFEIPESLKQYIKR